MNATITDQEFIAIMLHSKVLNSLHMFSANEIAKYIKQNNTTHVKDLIFLMYMFETERMLPDGLVTLSDALHTLNKQIAKRWNYEVPNRKAGYTVHVYDLKDGNSFIVDYSGVIKR